MSVKRDDLIHPEISGNKYRKLKYNLQNMHASGCDTMITFGGAFSNHLHAVAAACFYLNIPCVGIVRGETSSENNPTLSFCRENGMKLHFVPRHEYRLKTESNLIQNIIRQYAKVVVIPEGGSNEEALTGIAEVWDELKLQENEMPDYIFCAAGTGTTLAGLLKSTPLKTKILGFSSLKSSHLEAEILRMAGKAPDKTMLFFDSYHFGGYAKTSSELKDFIHTFEACTGIPLDHIYNGKAVFGMFDLIQKDYFPSGTRIMWLHTGGLQGNHGFQYLKNLSCPVS